MHPSLWLNATSNTSLVALHHRPSLPRPVVGTKLTRCTRQARTHHRLLSRSTQGDDAAATAAASSTSSGHDTHPPDDLLKPPPKTTYQPVFAPFVARQMAAFSKEYRLNDGATLLILPLNTAWIDPAATLLAECFQAIVLVAVLLPAGYDQSSIDAISSTGSMSGDTAGTSSYDDSTCDSISMSEPVVPGEASDPLGPLLVGTVELSFSETTRYKYMTLNPPADCTYLCNMAVGEGFRRRGFARRLLTAAEELAEQVGERDMYLHVRVQDDPAVYLYKGAGYQVRARDLIFVRALGLDQRKLLYKRLGGGPCT